MPYFINNPGVRYATGEEEGPEGEIYVCNGYDSDYCKMPKRLSLFMADHGLLAYEVGMVFFYSYDTRLNSLDDFGEIMLVVKAAKKELKRRKS